MLDQFSRTSLIFGPDAMELLKDKKVAVFGIGGVGGYVCEALARSGVYNLTLIDNDTVSITNINRQIVAYMDTCGKDKTEIMKNRILSINPDANIETYKCFFLPENADEFDFSKYDYVVDCVDTVSAKIALVLKAQKEGTKIISAMGAGNKINPTMLEVSDIYKTKVDPLAKVMRTELKKRGVKKLKVVYSKEKPLINDKELSNQCKKEENVKKRSVPGSAIFVPAAMGLIIASEIIKDLTGIRNEDAGA